MIVVDMNQPIRWSDGTVATPSEVVDSDRGYVEVVEVLPPTPGKQHHPTVMRRAYKFLRACAKAQADLVRYEYEYLLRNHKGL